MGQIRQIRRRLKSVDKIKQITRAMELVATSKIKKAEDRIRAARPYAQKMVDIIQNLSTQTGAIQHPLLERRETTNKTALLVLTSNRGLCGAFNTNVIRKTEQLYKEEAAAGREVKLLTVGKKGTGYFSHRGYPIADSYTEIPDAPRYEDAAVLAARLMELYTTGEADQVFIVFNHYRSVAEQRPVVFKLFPLEPPASTGEPAGPPKEYLFEPDAAALAATLLPAYAETVTYRTLLESAASEQGARRTAMKNATDNSTEMIGDLTLALNRARQSQITQELSEITGTVEALKYSAEKQ